MFVEGLRVATVGVALVHGLEVILESLRDLAKILVSRGARAVAVFGSAARGVDFIPCRSDVDVFVIALDEQRLPRRVEVPELGYRVSIALYTMKRLRNLLEAVHPVLLHLYRASIVYFDDGTLSSILDEIPRRIVRRTIEIEELSTAVALVLGLEKLALDIPEEALDHVHHALRHLARALIGIGKPITMFPAYDIEVETVLEQRDSSLAKLFRDVRSARAMCRADRDTAKKLLEKTWSAVSQHLNLEIPSLDSVVELCGHGETAEIEVPLFVHREGNTIVITCGSKEVKL